MLALAAAAALVAVVAAVLVVTVSGDDDRAASDPIVALDERGRVVVFDREGDEVDRIATGHGSADTTIVAATGDSVVLHDDEESVVVIVDLGSGEVTELTVPDGAIVAPVVGADRLLFATAPPGGADAVIIDVDGARAVDPTDGADLDDEPLLVPSGARASTDGDVVAVLDSRSFSTIVVTLGDEREPLVLPGAPVTVTSDRITTGDGDGDGDEVRVRSFDRDGEERSDTTIDRAARWVPVGDSVLWFGDDGRVTRTGADGDDPEDLGSVRFDVDTGFVAAVADGQRAVAVGDDSVLVIDADADEVGRVEDLDTSRPQGGLPLAARCVSFGEDEITTIDTESGQVVATTPGSIVTVTSTDGCTLAIEGAEGSRLVRDGELVDLGEDLTVTALAPDGTGAIVRDREGRARLVELDELDELDELVELDELDEPDAPGVELVDGFARYAFVLER